MGETPEPSKSGSKGGIVVAILGGAMVAGAIVSGVVVDTLPANIVLFLVGLAMLVIGTWVARRKRGATFFTARQVTAFFLIGCSSFVLFFFLFTGEDSPFNYQTMGSHDELLIFQESGISAYTYFFRWPRSRRDALRQGEDAGYAIYLMMHGYSAHAADEVAIQHNPSWMVPDQYKSPTTLGQLMVRNLSLAVVGGLGLTALCVVLAVRRSVPAAMADGEPAAVAPGEVREREPLSVTDGGDRS